MTDVRREGLGYVMQITDAATELRCGATTRSRGELLAELSVSCALPGVASRTGHIFRGRFNFSSVRTRSELAKHLTARTPGSELDWQELLEQFCVGVLAGASEGQPFVRVGRLPQRLAERFLVDPLLPLGKPTILFGDGGVGKSYLAVGMAVSVESGYEIVPGFRPARGHVLYLDWESDQADLDERVKAVSAGAEIEPPEITYRRCLGPLRAQLEAIARQVSAEDVTLVVVDSVGLAMGATSETGDANQGAIELFEAFAELGAGRVTPVTALAIDHVSKEASKNEGGAGKPYGSGYKAFLARSTWELRQGKERESDGTMHLGLFHRKSNLSREHQPIGLRYTNEDGRLVYWQREPITEASLEKSLSQPDRIAAALREAGPLSDVDLADYTGIDISTLRAVLSRAMKKGRFAKSETTKKWALGVAHAS
jgi:hypothetical protein